LRIVWGTQRGLSPAARKELYTPVAAGFENEIRKTKEESGSGAVQPAAQLVLYSWFNIDFKSENVSAALKSSSKITQAPAASPENTH